MTIEKATECVFELQRDVGFWIAITNRHSLVCHPVSFHKDVFANKEGDKLENKICLVNFRRSNQKEELPLGRGGAGPGYYVFAIIDWEGTKKKRRKIYVDATQDAARRVTAPFFRNWVINQAPEHVHQLNEIEAAIAAL